MRISVSLYWYRAGGVQRASLITLFPDPHSFFCQGESPIDISHPLPGCGIVANRDRTMRMICLGRAVSPCSCARRCSNCCCYLLVTWSKTQARLRHVRFEVGLLHNLQVRQNGLAPPNCYQALFPFGESLGTRLRRLCVLFPGWKGRGRRSRVLPEFSNF